jgi:hypothetical protein
MRASHWPMLRGEIALPIPLPQQFGSNRSPAGALLVHVERQHRRGIRAGKPFQRLTRAAELGQFAPESAREYGGLDAGGCRASRRWNTMSCIGFVSIFIRKPGVAIRIALSPGFFFYIV